MVKSMNIMRSLVRLGSVAVVVSMLTAVNGSAQTAEHKQVVSDKPLTSEQLTIYHEILEGWMDNGKHAVHLSIETVPLEEGAKGCIKGVRLEASDPATVHRFRQEDLPQLGSAKVGLVDPEAQSKEVEKNDPGTAIGNGKSIDEAVDNGFAHGLVTLSEIQFDEKHQLAIVWYGFRCGGLCGNGGTVVFEKKNGAWQMRKRPCSIWMS